MKGWTLTIAVSTPSPKCQVLSLNTSTEIDSSLTPWTWHHQLVSVTEYIRDMFYTTILRKIINIYTIQCFSHVLTGTWGLNVPNSQKNKIYLNLIEDQSDWLRNINWFKSWSITFIKLVKIFGWKKKHNKILIIVIHKCAWCQDSMPA